METLIGFQHWLYGGIAEGIGSVAGGDYRVVWVAMATATLFGAVHALMPGHGKLVLISYHLGQPSSPTAVPSQSSWADAHIYSRPRAELALIPAGYISLDI